MVIGGMDRLHNQPVAELLPTSGMITNDEELYHRQLLSFRTFH